LMARAGFDPRAAVTLWQAMSRQGSSQSVEFLSTHPSNVTRINALAAQIPRVLPQYQQALARGIQPRCA